MKRILIVEDEDVIRDFEVINLKRAGYEVVDVPNGDEALRVTYAADARLTAEYPPVFVVASRYDRLKKESDDFTDELEAAGTKHGYFLCTGINGVHAGALACELSRSGRECLAEAKKFVQEALVRSEAADGEK